MAYFGEQFIEEVKSANDVVDIVSEYVSLNRSGTSHKGLCPFHKEKTPSFMVSADRQIFHCFGCGLGGDVIRFLMLIENLDFTDAVEILANRARIEIPIDNLDIDIEKIKLREALFKMNIVVAKYYHQNLSKNQNALDYLTKRKLDNQIVTKFGLGFANGGSNDLTKHLLNEGYTKEQIFLGGFAMKNSQGALVDKFRNRLMFPIFDIKDRVIAFGGRVLDDSLPKYMNSPDTPIYNKSKHVFGLNFARKSRASGLIMVEGYMDVISLHKYGITGAVASLGTSLTEGQVRLIRKYFPEVTMSYDSDGAGQNATSRGIEILSSLDCNVKVLEIPGAKDPDEYINKNGPEKFKKLLGNSKTLVEYKLSKLKNDIDMRTTEGKIDYLKKSAEVLSKINSLVEREVYTKKISEEIGVGADAITAELNKFVSIDNKKYSKFKIETKKVNLEQKKGENIPENVYNAEKMLIFLLCKNEKELFDEIKKYIAIEKFNVNLYKELAEILYSYYDGAVKKNIVDLFNKPEHINIITGFMQEDYDFGNNTYGAIKDIAMILEKFNLEEQKRRILTELGNTDDEVKVRELENELNDLLIKLYSVGGRK